jgi:O-antigen/teichoic acid export membrane protein
MINFRSLFRSAFVYTLLGFLPMASAFLLTPIFTKYLLPEEYGVIALSNVFQSFLAIFIAIGIDAAFTRFYFKYNKHIITRALLSTALICILSISAILYVLFIFIGEYVFKISFNVSGFTFNEFGQYIFITTTFACTYSIISQYYRDTENLKSFSWLAVIYFILVTSGSYIGVVIMGLGAKGSVMGKMVGTFITMILYLFIFFSKTGFIFKKKYAIQMYIYGYPLVIYAILATTFDSMDKLFLSKYFKLSELGHYNLAFAIASTIGIILNSMQAATSPNIYKLLNSNEDNNHEQINKIYRYTILATLFIIVSCIALSYPLLNYYINERYQSSIIYVPFLSLAFLARAYFMIYSNPLFFHGKTLYLPFINGILVVIGLVANYILIKQLGIIGVPISVLIIKLSQAFLTFLVIKKTLLYNKIEYQLNQVHTLSFFVILSVIITNSNIIPDINNVKIKYALPLITFLMFFLISTIQNSKNKSQ